MAQAQHTPGPWIANTVPSDGETFILGGNDIDICTMDWARPDQDIAADARLIAAAPDLLEELEQQADGMSTIIGLLEGQQSAVAGTLRGMLRFQENSARAAIAKAIGEPA